MAPIGIPEERGQGLLGSSQSLRIDISRQLVRGFIPPKSCNIDLQHSPGTEDDQMFLCQFRPCPQQHAPGSIVNVTRQDHSDFNIIYGDLSHITPCKHCFTACSAASLISYPHYFNSIFII